MKKLIAFILSFALTHTPGFAFTGLASSSITKPIDIISTTYQYDTASRLLSVIASASEAISYNYTYNDVGNRTSLTDPLGAHNYEYDNIDQLTRATHPALPEENFTYDALGNRNPLSTTYDATNRLLEDAGYRYIYDANGNRITKVDIATGEITTYTYNSENQLITINYPLSTINYFYDGLGRRIEKNLGGEVTRYIYDGMDILAEYNGANELTRSYVHGPSIDEPLQAISYQPSAISHYYISDGLGSITAILDNSGNIVEQYRYDAFGNTTILNADGDEIPESAYGNSYMFTAREYDAETGLYYYRLRYYDPLVGRFLQEDPVGYLLGPNLYTYVNNNPVNWVDPWGLARWRQRPLDSKFFRTWAGGSTGSYSGGTFHHDQFFFDDGHRPSNLGFFKNGVHEDRASDWLQSQYENVADNLDDSALRQALAEVAENFGEYEGLGNNCQDFAEAVMKRYFELMEEDVKSKSK